MKPQVPTAPSVINETWRPAYVDFYNANKIVWQQEYRTQCYGKAKPEHPALPTVLNKPWRVITADFYSRILEECVLKWRLTYTDFYEEIKYSVTVKRRLNTYLNSKLNVNSNNRRVLQFYSSFTVVFTVEFTVLKWGLNYRYFYKENNVAGWIQSAVLW